MKKVVLTPGVIFGEYKAGRQYKERMGTRGMYAQNAINRRFLQGDQWSGLEGDGRRPLVRHNLVRRIADYKLSEIGADPLSVHFSAEGVPLSNKDVNVAAARQSFARGETPEMDPATERRLVTDALGDYFRVTAQRVGFEELRRQALRKAYVTGTGILYTYWDGGIATGLSQDGTPLKGDIACEVLDIEQVYLGDPTVGDVQKQPYLLIAQRRDVEGLQQEAARYGGQPALIRTDCTTSDPFDKDKTTVLTRLWKETTPNGVTVKAMRVCRGAVVRPAWDIGVRLYPLAKFDWELQDNCGYGASEIPWLIPNQIAVNRLLTASTWGMMSAGMPLMLVNGDLISGPVTNDPGQILQVFGGKDEMDAAVRFVAPPSFAPQFEGNIEALIANTLTQAGATAAALGDVAPNNTSAILALRRASIEALETVRMRYVAFCEQVARIWSEFWITQYGNRPLKIEDATGVWHLPFDGGRWRDALLSVKVGISTRTEPDDARRAAVLDSLMKRGLITAEEYIEQLPEGYLPTAEKEEDDGN